MILVDAVYINKSGTKVLLDYLVEKIELEKINCFYLFDIRCKSDYQFIPKERKLFLKASLIKRHRFYQRNKYTFSKVLCFGNIPPTVKLNVPVITYFQQLLFLDVPKSVSFINKMTIKLKTIILNSIKSNTNFWLVQTEYIREKLSSKYKIKLNDVRVMPFYPPLKTIKTDFNRRKDGFVYISNGGMHKNHFNLIEAFCNYFDQTHKGILYITISDEFPKLIQLIQTKKDLGYPIVNLGFIERNDLVEIYQTNEYLIFPSLAESFGLGLIEAIENGCNVIGADLPYTYEVCNPSIVFNPLVIDDIKRALVESQSGIVKKTEQLITNKIEGMIRVLSD